MRLFSYMFLGGIHRFDDTNHHAHQRERVQKARCYGATNSAARLATDQPVSNSKAFSRSQVSIRLIPSLYSTQHSLFHLLYVDIGMLFCKQLMQL